MSVKAAIVMLGAGSLGSTEILLRSRQRELLNEFEEASSHDTHPEAMGFFARMKELFGK